MPILDSASKTTEHPTFGCRRIIAALLALLLWGYNAPHAQNSPISSVPLKEIRFAVLDDIYTDIARRDARLALETIMQKVMMEMNPQISERIHVLYQSTGLVRQVICATQNASPDEIETFVNESIHVESNPDTDQALTIIQTKRFHPVTHKGIEATMQLLSDHRAGR